MAKLPYRLDRNDSSTCPKTVHQVFFYNLKQLELMFIILGTQYPDTPSCEHEFPPRLTLFVMLHYSRLTTLATE